MGADLAPTVRSALREEHLQKGSYALLGEAEWPWINMHDRYFEDGIGGAKWWGKTEPLKADWLTEMPWRVSTLNASDRHFLEHFVAPLRHGDVFGFTKGGFLIGTSGTEQYLREFSRAFCALPAERFEDVGGSTELVKARTRKSPEGAWAYVVNTGAEKVRVSLRFDREPQTLRDLGRGEAIGVDARGIELELRPYELRSLRAEGAAVTAMQVLP